MPGPPFSRRSHRALSVIERLGALPDRSISKAAILKSGQGDALEWPRDWLGAKSMRKQRDVFLAPWGCERENE